MHTLAGERVDDLLLDTLLTLGQPLVLSLQNHVKFSVRSVFLDTHLSYSHD